MSETLVVDDLRFALERSPRRKTVGITVERDGSLSVRAPEDCSRDRVEEIVHEKRFWIYTKLAEKERLFRPAPPKEYVSGETFHYLGRAYRLKIVEGEGKDTLPLRLHQGRFLLRADAVDRGEEHFIRWYIDHGRPWLARKVKVLGERIGVMPTSVDVRDLGYRWGSCGVRGGVNFHWRTVLLPPGIVEYVVAHELVHLLVPDHGVEFWTRLERAMPDFSMRKRWLAEAGGNLL